MADDEPENADEPEKERVSDDGEEKSFRERVEEIRQRRAEEREEGEEGEMSREERMEEMMGGGGGPGGPGGMGGQPGPGGREEGGSDNEDLTREIRKLRDEVNDVRRSLDRIADALED